MPLSIPPGIAPGPARRSSSAPRPQLLSPSERCSPSTSSTTTPTGLTAGSIQRAPDDEVADGATEVRPRKPIHRHPVCSGLINECDWYRVQGETTSGEAPSNTVRTDAQSIRCAERNPTTWSSRPRPPGVPSPAMKRGQPVLRMPAAMLFIVRRRARVSAGSGLSMVRLLARSATWSSVTGRR
jgi:hypothetical protein